MSQSSESERAKTWAKSMLAKLPPKDEFVSGLPERNRQLCAQIFDELTLVAEQGWTSELTAADALEEDR